jgi:cytochrome b561
MGWLHRLWDARGYVFLLIIPTGALLRGSPLAAIDVGLIGLILALSKDGPMLFGHPSRVVRSKEWMRTPLVAAILMVMPVKTLSALLGAESETALRSVAQHATIGLLLLAIMLGILPSIFRRFKEPQPGAPAAEKMWVVAADLLVLLLLLALGRDGVALFGESANSFQRAFPLLHEPWMRGFIAAIPVKTVSTLVFAGSWKRRIEIANNGMPLMATLAVLTFGVASASQFGMLWAYAVGASSALLMFLATENYKRFLKGS